MHACNVTLAGTRPGDESVEHLMRRVLLLAILGSAVLALTGRPAAADCGGPTIEIAQRTIAPGGELTLIGSWWGDSCYDTGPPPSGQGVLGTPMNDVEIYVRQGASEWLVATGSADRDYAFEVTVTAPAGLKAGSAELQARWRGNDVSSSAPDLVVVEGSAPTAADTTVVSFGPSPVVAPSEEQNDRDWPAAVVIAAGVAAVAAAIVVARARRN